MLTVSSATVAKVLRKVLLDVIEGNVTVVSNRLVGRSNLQ